MHPVWLLMIGLTARGLVGKITRGSVFGFAKQPILLFFALACSSSKGDMLGDFSTGGMADQSSAGGSTASGGTQASTTGPTLTGGLRSTGGSRAVPHTGGTSALPGYPFSRCIFTCYCVSGSTVVDLHCPASTDPALNLCVSDLNVADAGLGCTGDCTSYCTSQGSTCASISSLSCTK